jgi:hypothetical protein
VRACAQALPKDTVSLLCLQCRVSGGLQLPNLIDWVEQEMSSDQEDREKQSSKLRMLYEESGPVERQVLDDALICLCGYSFATALTRSSEDFS